MSRLLSSLAYLCFITVSLSRTTLAYQQRHPLLVSSSCPRRLLDRTKAIPHTVLSIPRGGGGGGASSSQLNSAFASINTFLKAHPLIAAAAVCATKATLADIVAQRRQTDTFDARRLLSFLLYGALYQGMVQELIYNDLYTYLFGSSTKPLVVAKKVFFDAIFHNALVCIPMAYVFKALVFGNPVTTGVRQYIEDVRYKGLLLKYYTLWMPVNAMLFTIVPPHWRISVMAVVSFFWIIILSSISSRAREGTS